MLLLYNNQQWGSKVMVSHHPVINHQYTFVVFYFLIGLCGFFLVWRLHRLSAHTQVISITLSSSFRAPATIFMLVPESFFLLCCCIKTIIFSFFSFTERKTLSIFQRPAGTSLLASPWEGESELTASLSPPHLI